MPASPSIPLTSATVKASLCTSGRFNVRRRRPSLAASNFPPHSMSLPQNTKPPEILIPPQLRIDDGGGPGRLKFELQLFLRIERPAASPSRQKVIMINS
ncbi:hypothetical protein Nepgr_023755 [Nepenthes gracilis]|uniref:Uncharacterized protein n=1 Tax=Nepenthes gracilis TaxID=150966 RepID=A0AAD3XXZ8_NEPGR|nr:hypothetical protein Nepgr_023755 [Nepenthes gracilis]